MSDVVVDNSQVIPRRQDQSEERKVKRLTVIALLLLLLLGLLLLLYLMFFRTTVKEDRAGISWLFSIYNLKTPHGVGTDSSGNVFVSDTGNHRVLMFDNDGKYIKEIGSKKKKDERFYSPYGAYVDSKTQDVYICDWSAKGVVITDKKGKRKAIFPDNPLDKVYGKRGFTPYQMAVYKNEFYVTSNDGVYIFDKKGKLKRNWSDSFDKKGDFNFPNGIAVDQKTGDVFVADVLNRRVVALNNKGKILWTIGRGDKLVPAKKGTGKVGKLVSFFQLPRSIAIHPKSGNLYVTDTFADQIVVLSPKGELLSMIGKRGVEDGSFNFIEGITFRDDGVAYVVDRGSDRVQAIKFTEPLPKPQSFKKKTYDKQFKKFK